MEPMRLYILADKYGIIRLKNLIAKPKFDAMKQNGMTRSNIDTVAYVYHNVSERSGIWKLSADFHACKIIFEWYEHAQAKEFLQRYLNLLLMLR